MGYKEELDFVLQFSDDTFSSIIDNIQFNDFGDNYYERGVYQDPLTESIKALRRRYTDFFDYMAALDIYHEYMDNLIDRYGSKSIVKSSAKLGLLEEYVPPKPKLKNTKKNREFLRAGAVPSRQVEEANYLDDIVELSDYIYPVNEDSYSKITEDKELSPKALKGHQNAANILIRKYRRHNIYNTSGSNFGTDFIVEYLNQASKGFYDTTGIHHNVGLVDMMNERDELASMPPELRELEFAPPTTVINGQMVNLRQMDQIKLLKDLFEAGFDFISGDARGINKQTIKMVKHQVGYGVAQMSKEELKKWKKHHKKEQKLLDHHADADSILSNTLLDNKYSFYDSERGAGSMRLADLYRDDD